MHAPDLPSAPFMPNRRRALLALTAGSSAALGLLPSAQARQGAARWYPEALHAFISSEGSRAVGSPVFVNSELYGVHAMGGENGVGSVYRWSHYRGFSVLHHFNYADGGPFGPEAGLVIGQDGLLWGTSMFGGVHFQGTIYAMTLDGSVTMRAEFDPHTGLFEPQGALVEGRPGRFYGTTRTSIYRFDARPGGKLKQLYRFNGPIDGGGSTSALVFGPDGKLYGCNPSGGPHGHGTIFRIAIDGSGFEVLKALDGKWEGSGLGHALLLASDGMFYGCASGGGVFKRGVVFRLAADGSYEVLHHFAGGSNDGAYPRCALVEGLDGALYGNTVEGGDAPQSYGTVFRMTRNGKLRLLLRFDANGANGNTPVGALCFGYGLDERLYGTNQGGGDGGSGVLYRLGT